MKIIVRNISADRSGRDSVRVNPIGLVGRPKIMGRALPPRSNRIVKSSRLHAQELESWQEFVEAGCIQIVVSPIASNLGTSAPKIVSAIELAQMLNIKLDITTASGCEDEECPVCEEEVETETSEVEDLSTSSIYDPEPQLVEYTDEPEAEIEEDIEPPLPPGCEEEECPVCEEEEEEVEVQDTNLIEVEVESVDYSYTLSELNLKRKADLKDILESMGGMPGSLTKKQIVNEILAIQGD